MEGKRTILYLEAIRLIRECEPKFVFLENVPGIRRFVPSIRGELEALGYDCRDGFLSAAEVGARHIRNRWWLLAYNTGFRVQTGRQSIGTFKTSSDERQPQPGGDFWIAKCDRWSVEPDVGRVVHGVRNRMDRIKGLGNAVVPQQAREAFKKLMGIK